MAEIYVGTYWHRFNEASSFCYGFTREAVEEAVQAAAEWEEQDLRGYCDIDHDDETPEDECLMCTPDIVIGCVDRVYSVRDLGGVRAAISIIRDAREHPNKVTWDSI